MSDRIEKQIQVNAPVARVWRALTDAREFTQWFGVNLDTAFRLGEVVRCHFDAIDPKAIAAAQVKLGLAPAPIKPPSQTPQVFCVVEAMQRGRRFAFRWTPFGIDAAADPEHEAMTLVEFTLTAKDEGTLLTIVESGFDRIPEHRRDRAYRMNDAGWAAQAENVKRHVEG